MAEPNLKKYMENNQAESNPTKPITNDDIIIELSKEILLELKNNACHGMINEDVVDHIAKVFELLDLIKILGVDSHRLRMKVFPLSLADDARQWWINEGEGKITTWEELVEKIFSHDERNIIEGNELIQMKRKGDNRNDEQPIKRVCKAEKFEAIKYLLGPNEEYIAVRRCEYNTWERNKERPRCKEIDDVGEVSTI
ncbi:hypothetical protein Tco_1226007 [Tanacetum coccineum]